MGATKRSRPKSLSKGRPPSARTHGTMSRKASRTLINRHHQLEKRRRQAEASGDACAVAAIIREIAELGGLDQYQKASLQGQSLDRGGDSSKVLLDWLPVGLIRDSGCKLKMLEIGALSTNNACSKSGLFDMTHIDLNSQDPGILQQNFMDRPLPKDRSDSFDVLSLSLVLNFVPDAIQRGRMLARTRAFLRPADGIPIEVVAKACPMLFMVLPRSCLNNSRYFSDSRFTDLMAALGFVRLQVKITQKLAYSLWKKVGTSFSENKFPKQEINPGKSRNNFVITLKGLETIPD